MLLDVPKDLLFIFSLLKNNGYESYLVGGCIRDALLKKSINDYDITTSATPTEMIKSLKDTAFHVVSDYSNFGTILVDEYEITTMRVDGKYSDSRRPDEVFYTTDISLDLTRRDFTINAIAYEPFDNKLVFSDNSCHDLQAKQIRCVGDPKDRFTEDPLRILRAIRLSMQHDFKIENKTLKAMLEYKDLLKNLSSERIRDELNKIIVLCNSENHEYLKLTMEFLFPEFKAEMEQNNPYHDYGVLYHTLHSVHYIEPLLVLRLTMLFHDIGKYNTKTTDENGIDFFSGHSKESTRLTKKYMSKLKYSNEIKDLVVLLVQEHDTHVNPDKVSIRKILNRIGLYNTRLLIKVKRADAKAHNQDNLDYYLNQFNEIEDLIHKIISDEEPLFLSDLAVNGNDVKAYGFDGVEVGNILDCLLDKVLEDPNLNRKEFLLREIELKTK